MTRPANTSGDAAATPTTTLDPPSKLPPPPPPPSSPPGTPGNRGRGGDGRSVPPRPARRSRFWVVAGSVLVVPTILWGAFQVVLMVAHETETVTDVVVADGITTVEIRNPTGSVEVVGADVDELTVTAQVDHGLRRTGYGHRIEGDRLVVWGTCPVIGSSWCEVHHRLQVPSQVAVEVRSAGSVSLRDLDGPVEARISNGAVTASGLSGPTDLHSSNGAVRVDSHRGDDVLASSRNGAVRLSFDVPPVRASAVSRNGTVEVLLPRDEEIRYRVTVESRNGTRTNEVVTDPGSDRDIVARTTNGAATVRYR